MAGDINIGRIGILIYPIWSVTVDGEYACDDLYSSYDNAGSKCDLLCSHRDCDDGRAGTTIGTGSDFAGAGDRVRSPTSSAAIGTGSDDAKASHANPGHEEPCYGTLNTQYQDIHPQISQVGSRRRKTRRSSDVWSVSVCCQNVHHDADFGALSLSPDLTAHVCTKKFVILSNVPILLYPYKRSIKLTHRPADESRAVCVRAFNEARCPIPIASYPATFLATLAELVAIAGTDGDGILEITILSHLIGVVLLIACGLGLWRLGTPGMGDVLTFGCFGLVFGLMPAVIFIALS